MDRIWNIPLQILATMYFVVDALFAHVTHPIAAWLGQIRLLERARRWIVSLRPYPSLALLVVPLIVLEPVKPLSAYLAATGHWFAGAITFIAGEVLKLTVTERLFQINRKKLLSIPAFEKAYGYWRRMMNAIESIEAWKACRRLANNTGRILRAYRLRFNRAKGTYRLQFRGLD